MLQTLMERHEADYRLIFLMETAFCARINDVYLARGAFGNAPFLEDVIFEMCDLAVLLFVEHMHTPELFNTLDLFHIEQIRQHGDPEMAVEFINKYIPPTFLDLFQRDVYLYLLANQINFFVKPINRAEATFKESRLLNPTIIQVW